jgi:hypothetical protein
MRTQDMGKSSSKKSNSPFSILCSPFFVLFSILILHATPALAQESLSVTVTPPLIQLTIGPGESWASSLKIVNTNSYDVTYYATPVDFEAEGEAGTGTFMPLLDVAQSGSTTLASWIDISRDPITIQSGTSGDVPFAVHIPESASPGGHYAAILVGTAPPGDAPEGPTVKISSFVSSLLFVRIKGDVDERARIREFRTERQLYQEPKADFLLRFENLGTTHVRPQGEIVLYNMWGKERGRVQLGQKSAFGNVLPNSVRRFSFQWAGEDNVFDIGRYSAVVTLSFGEDQKQNMSATTYFWVIPVVPVSITLGSILVFVLLVAWLIRRYIRRALALERAHFGVAARAPLSQTTALPAPQPSTILGFLKEHSLLFFFLSLLVAAGFWLSAYFNAVLVPERGYEITDISTEEESEKNE